MTPSWEDGVTINSMWENRGRKGWEENVGCIFVLMIKQDSCAIFQKVLTDFINAGCSSASVFFISLFVIIRTI